MLKHWGNPRVGLIQSKVREDLTKVIVVRLSKLPNLAPCEPCTLGANLCGNKPKTNFHRNRGPNEPRAPVPMAPANMVNQEDHPWCRCCQGFHEESSCHEYVVHSQQGISWAQEDSNKLENFNGLLHGT